MITSYQVTAVTADGTEHAILTEDDEMLDAATADRLARRVSRLPGVDHARLDGAGTQGGMNPIWFRDGTDLGRHPALPRKNHS